MSKAQRAREQSARARIAAQQAEQRRKDQRRRMLAIGGVAVALLAVIGIIVGALVSRSSPASQPAAGSRPLPAGVQAKLSVPVGTLATVGIGSSGTQLLKPVTGPALASGGKPEMLYIGAEWCPYCAAERWAMAVALSRFGTFSNLKLIHSSGTDVYPNTSTLSFYKSAYTSQYLDFQPVEWYSNKPTSTKGVYKTLQVPTTAQPRSTGSTRRQRKGSPACRPRSGWPGCPG